MIEGTRYFHVGLVVADVDAAMQQLGETLGLEWTPVRESPLPGHARPLRVVFSRQGPPFFELLEGPPGSAWDATDGARVDHLGFWTDDLSEASEHLEQVGAPIVVDGSQMGVALNYHALHTAGLRLEVFDDSERQGFTERWGHTDIGSS